MEKLLELYRKPLIQWVLAWMHFQTGKPPVLYTHAEMLSEMIEDIRRSDAEREKEQFLTDMEKEKAKGPDDWPPKRTAEQIVLEMYDAKIKTNTRNPLTK